MEGPHYVALCPYDKTPVHQQADFSYYCPKCGRTIQSHELVWKRADTSKKKG